MNHILDTFSRDLYRDYSLQNKHLFKKKAGSAKYYYQLLFDETLERDLYTLHELYIERSDFKVFGLHTNLYITENGYDGLFVDINPQKGKIDFDKEKEEFIVTANIPISMFINFSMKKGYDFSALAGVPGLIGSGVVGNSGWTPSGKALGDFVRQITVYDFEKNAFTVVVPDETFFGDRWSLLKEHNSYRTRFFVKEVVLKGEYLGQEVVREKYETQINKRKESLRYGFQEGTAGSLWSNAHIRKEIGNAFPNMLRQNPCINRDFNGAKYSPNGNWYFTTEKNTTDYDVARLFLHTLRTVEEIYHIRLHKEIIILDRDGEIDVDIFIKRNLDMV